MLGVGAAANGLVGASANPFDAAASDLAENSDLAITQRPFPKSS